MPRRTKYELAGSGTSRLAEDPKIVLYGSLSEPKWDLPVETRRGKCNRASRELKRAPAILKWLFNACSDRVQELEMFIENIPMVWVIQEVYSAKRPAVLWGDESIPWNLLLEAQECLNRNQKTLWGLVGDQPSLVDFISDIWYRGPRGLRSETEESELTLFDTLRWHSDKLSTRPEDKVYALFGITRARDDPCISIDYTRGVRQIYIDTASYIIQSTQRLDVICGLQYRTRDLFNLPSWVVDWTDIYNGCLMNLHPAVFQTDGSHRAEVDFGSDGASLTVRGFCIGTIEASGQRKVSEQQGEYQRLLALCSDFHLARSKTGCVLLSELIGFCKNFTCGRILEDVEILADQPEEDASKVILAIFFLWDPEQYIRPSTIISEILDGISPLWSNEKLEKWGSLILKDFKRVLDPRRFFICENGLQGSAFHQASIGCKICTLSGCQTPIVLRPVSGLGEHDVL